MEANNQFPCLAYGAKEMLWDTTDTDTAEPFEAATRYQCQ